MTFINENFLKNLPKKNGLGFLKLKDKPTQFCDEVNKPVFKESASCFLLEPKSQTTALPVVLSKKIVLTDGNRQVKVNPQSRFERS